MKIILFRHLVFLLIVGSGCLSCVPALAQNGALKDPVKFIFGWCLQFSTICFFLVWTMDGDVTFF